MVMVTLTTGIMFFLFTFECGELYEGGPRVRRLLIRPTGIAEIMRNT
jgi:hypothetical protein